MPKKQKTKKTKKVLVEKDKLDEILRKEDEILKGQKKILKEEEKLEEMEEKDLEGDKEIELGEEEAFEELKKIEKKLQNIQNNPMKKITKRDITKGFVGAFFGIVGHFAFYKGVGIAETLTIFQATLLYLFAIGIITVMLYYTGFRKIEKKLILRFMPLRIIALYSVSIISIIIVLALFGKLHFPLHFVEIYKQIGAIIILAVIGAGAADLIGKTE
jgi:uncharacterized membrane protein